MTATPEDLFARLDALGIRHVTHRHPPVRTVAESVALRGALPGLHCKSLFLADRKGGLYLVVVPEAMRLDLGALARRLGAARLSFAGAARMFEVLGVVPGAVTPFAVINLGAAGVVVVLDAALLQADLLNYHPLVNTATTALAPTDLLRFLAACGHPPRILALDALDRAGPA